MSISYEEALARFNYSPETGYLTWKTHKNSAMVGRPAVNAEVNGYPTVQLSYTNTKTQKIERRSLLAQRLIWLLSFSVSPGRRERVSQKDGNKKNLKLSNLEAPSFESRRAASFGCILTQARALEVFNYDPYSGELYWKKMLNARGPEGAIAGTTREDRYKAVKVDGKLVLVHRVVWLMSTGSFPKEGLDIDHINQDPSDNRLENLRAVSRSTNLHNVDAPNKNSKRNFRGVFKQGAAYYARIKVDWKEERLGPFGSEELAVQAHLQAKAKIFQEATR